ncbi:MAG: hypothetical protein KIH63_002760 [Candidatus Saccharibacteria bacterium]|nr:hypothetical protein [Candidatus Saccharibacteria bacterium]
MAVRRIVVFEGQEGMTIPPEYFDTVIQQTAVAFGLTAEVVRVPVLTDRIESLANQLPPGYFRRSDIEPIAQDRGINDGVVTRVIHAAVARGQALDKHPASTGRHVIIAADNDPNGVFVHATVLDSLLHGAHQLNFGETCRDLADAFLEAQRAQLAPAPEPTPPPTDWSSLSLTYNPGGSHQ